MLLGTSRYAIRQFGIAAILIGGATGPLPGQADQLSAGDRVRFSVVRSGYTTWAYGAVVAASDTTVTLRIHGIGDTLTGPREYQLTDLPDLAVARGRKSNRISGAVAGAAVGGTVGAILGVTHGAVLRI